MFFKSRNGLRQMIEVDIALSSHSFSEAAREASPENLRSEAGGKVNSYERKGLMASQFPPV